jgi:hypothetical protein
MATSLSPATINYSVHPLDNKLKLDTTDFDGWSAHMESLLVIARIYGVSVDA